MMFEEWQQLAAGTLVRVAEDDTLEAPEGVEPFIVSLSSLLQSSKSEEIINRQTPVDPKTLERIKKALKAAGVSLEQTEENDMYLNSRGAEGIVFYTGDHPPLIVLHTRASASGLFEELIHYGQIINGRMVGVDFDDLLELEIRKEELEIEAKEQLIRNARIYRISEYEIEVLTETVTHSRMRLNEMLLIRGS